MGTGGVSIKKSEEKQNHEDAIEAFKKYATTQMESAAKIYLDLVLGKVGEHDDPLIMVNGSAWVPPFSNTISQIYIASCC